MKSVPGRRACKIEACSSPQRTKGMCVKHYSRFIRHGDPLGGGTPTGAAALFLETALTHIEDKCLIWPFARHGDGYAAAKQGHGKSRRASRYLCDRLYGKPPTPLHEAAHSCGNGHLGCIAPKHLRWATRAENEADKFSHGTSKRKRPNTLSESSVLEIRARYATGVVKQKDLAEEFDVCSSMVSQIVNRKTWAHVR